MGKELIVSLKKQYLKGESKCKVIFSLSRDSAGSARTAHIVGDFNKWERGANPMKRLKDGSFTATITLPKTTNINFAIWWMALRDNGIAEKLYGCGRLLREF